MTTRDGVTLDADIYTPIADGEFPILLMRQPYGRAIASTVVYAHPRWYAAQGYIVVIQDVRGRGTSEGKFDLFAHEIEDGFETVQWASQLPHSDGKVGMYGFSYQGMKQLYAAIASPPALKTLCPSMIGYDLYTDWAYENGAFCLQGNLSWAIQLAAETARLKGDETAYSQLYAASRNLPLYDPIPTLPKVLKEFAPDSFYFDWLKYPQPNSYWEKLSPKSQMQDVDLPMLHIGGWFDPYLRGTLNLYHEMSDRSRFPQHLIVGVWQHIPWGRKVGAVDYGINAATPVDELQVRWFDYFLKDIDNGILDNPPVCVFEMGSNQWRYFNTFPHSTSIDQVDKLPKKLKAQSQEISSLVFEESNTVYSLVSSGLANLREDSGQLIKTSETTENLNGNQFDILVHDPWRPVPALGGHSSFPCGSFDRSSIDCRSDVLTYTSNPLTETLHILGSVTVIVYCTADKPSFDLCAVLSEVKPDGTVYNFTQGYIRVNSNTNPVTIPLQATCIKISPGNRIRLSLSAACFPAYPVNPGTGAFSHESRLMDAEIITITVKTGKK